jgi:hypothetical protein
MELIGVTLVVVAFGIYLTERWIGPLLPWLQDAVQANVPEVYARIDAFLALQKLQQERVLQSIETGQKTLGQIGTELKESNQLNRLFYEASKEPLTDLMAAISERIRPVPVPDMGEPMPEQLAKWIQGWHDPYAQEDQRGRAVELFKELGNWDTVAMQLQSESEDLLDGDEYRVFDAE